MSAANSPKFFCESCDTEVPINARFCPKCGRFFASVHCPQCQYTGEHALFKDGCPNCGYAVHKNTDSADVSPARRETEPARKKKKKAHAYKSRENGDPLPVWIYIAVLMLLVIALKFVYDYLVV